MPKLVVKNFINIREAEIDMDKTLVLFIGATASGKKRSREAALLFSRINPRFSAIHQTNQCLPAGNL